MIGSQVCDALLARGEEVVALSRNPDGARSTNPTVTWHRWDPTAERPSAAALDGVDAVINLIGESLDQRLTPQAKDRILRSRERATKNLVDAIAAADPGPRVLVSQSAVGYYGDRGDAIVDESTEPGPDFLAQVCVAWEASARRADEADVRTTIFRTAPVLDAEGGLLKRLLLPFKLGIGGPLAGGRQYLPWIHVDDAVALYLWAVENDEISGTFNAVAPQQLTNREFSKTLGKVLRRPAAISAPKFAISALRGRELAEAVTSSQRAVPRRALDAGFEFRFPELEPALRDLLDR
jgi:uncharacterized protein (TIGR01777 family)